MILDMETHLGPQGATRRTAEEVFPPLLQCKMCRQSVMRLSHHMESCADWEKSLQAPAARQAKQQAAQQDAKAVQGAGASLGAVGAQLAKQVDQLASGALLGIGRRLAQAQGQVPC